MDSVVAKLPDWQKGWIAGMVDGEGNIGVYRYKNDARDTAKGHVAVYNTHCATLNMICTLTQLGNVRLVSKAESNNKASWIWSIQSAIDIYTFLGELTKYIFTKRQQAELLLEWCNGKIISAPIHDDNYYYKLTKQLNNIGGR